MVKPDLDEIDRLMAQFGLTTVPPKSPELPAGKTLPPPDPKPEPVSVPTPPEWQWNS